MADYKLPYMGAQVEEKLNKNRDIRNGQAWEKRIK